MSRKHAKKMGNRKQGLAKLIKRVKDGGIIICQIDKSRELPMMNKEVYQKAGELVDMDHQITHQCPHINLA